MSSGAKRDYPFEASNGGPKRSNVGQGAATSPATFSRLIDNEEAPFLMQDCIAASRAKSKGWIKNRLLSESEYLEIQAQMVELIRDQVDIQPLSREMILAALPALTSLEEETMETLLLQYDRHMRYEFAARCLVDDATHREGSRVSRLLKSESAALAQKWEIECKRLQAHCADVEKKLRTEMAQTLDDARQKAEKERDAQQRAHRSREMELLASLEKVKAAHKEADCRAEEAIREAERARAESDLKRECSQKLKEEVIENDKLTLATLNRIKMLEADLEASRRESQQYQSEILSCKREIESLKPHASENERLRAVLHEREKAYLRMSERMQTMSERLDSYESGVLHNKADSGRMAYTASRALQEEGQLLPIGSPPSASNEVVKSPLGSALKQSTQRRDSFLDRLASPGFGLGRQSILGFDF